MINLHSFLGALSDFAGWIPGWIFVYFLAINTTYTLLILFALRDIVRHSFLGSSRVARRLLTADVYYKPVSIVVPAYNEAAVIAHSIRSLLNLHYPEFEVIVVNDGSSDRTLEILTAEYKLRRSLKPVRLQVPHAAIRGVYASDDYPNLFVVDKENGGKADAINAGINVSSFPLFCSIDADSLLEPDAILKSSKLFIEDDELIATGGIVRVLNGCKVQDGAVLEVGLPEKNLEAIQVLEYTRAFLAGRTGWNMLKSLLIISGAFGVFRKDMVVAVNGYRRTVGEDMDLVMRLHRHCLDNNIRYKILFVPDPVCWTQVPWRVDMLRNQRNRWHRGLLDCLIHNRALILNPRYGAVSLIGVSYFLFIEVLGPFLELGGYFIIALLFLLGRLDTRFMLLFLAVAILWSISINIGAIFLDTYNYRRYKKEKDILRLCLVSIIEFFGFRQLTLFERVKASFSFRETSWGHQKRQALHPGEAAAAEAPGAPPAAGMAGKDIPWYEVWLSSPRVKRLGDAAAGFLTQLPAFALAMLMLRLGELLGGLPPGAGFAQAARAAEQALAQDLLTLVRYLPLLFLYSLPFLRTRRDKPAELGLNLAWLLPLAVQFFLVQYYLTARVPLGADLLAYTFDDIVTTALGGLPIRKAAVLGGLLGGAAFVAAIAVQRRRGRLLLKPRTAAAVLAASLGALLLLPSRAPYSGKGSEDTYNLALNKSAFFYDQCAGYLFNKAFPRKAAAFSAEAPRAGGFKYLDPQKYPFLRAEDTPDALGPLFRQADARPNFVFLILEGLGRSFTGPDALLGSFTPELDKLAAEGLYFDNFLAPQGRTFGIFTSLFASLPFGENGVAELGRKMPPFISSLKVMKDSGYRIRSYAGFDMDFDNDRVFLRRAGVDELTDRVTFGPGYTAATEWGYPDGDLFDRALKGEKAAAAGPFIAIVKTATTHTPYSFPGQAQYYPRLEARLGELGINGKDRRPYLAQKEIYSSLLYLDEAVSRFLREYSKLPAYRNTIFIVTADHRLPEVPMATRLDRYHVPLLVLSPLLKAPAHIKAVSSHFDVSPSLLAYLAHNYGLATPEAVTWLGSGLDTERSFRNTHSIPIMQTKTDLVDYVSGGWYLGLDLLYQLADGMAITPAQDAGQLARLRAEFSAFKAANAKFARENVLMPPGAELKLAPYNSQHRPARAPAPARAAEAGLAVREVRVSNDGGRLTAETVFANSGAAAADPFVPLLVLMSLDGRELSESYGGLQKLGAGEAATALLPVNAAGLPPGRYFLSVFPSHPDTGKKTGAGRYRIPVRLDGGR